MSHIRGKGKQRKKTLIREEGEKQEEDKWRRTGRIRTGEKKKAGRRKKVNDYGLGGLQKSDSL